MKSLYEIGQRARNRIGDYTVLAVDNDLMTIRYDDGLETQVKQAVQARIQQNMVADMQVATTLDKQRASSSRSSTSRGGRDHWGCDWSGLAESDFQKSTAGTHWRSRNSLGGALAVALSIQASCEMVSSAPWRIAETHIYDPHVYQTKNKSGQAKFLVKTFDDCCWHGLYIERSTEAMDDSWDWTRLLPALAQDQALQIMVWQAMRDHLLYWKLMDDGDEHCLATLTIGASETDLLMQSVEDGQPAGRTRTVDWAELSAFLDRGHSDKWMNLYLVHVLPKDDALSLGQALVNRAASAMARLLPLYRTCTQRKP